MPNREKRGGRRQVHADRPVQQEVLANGQRSASAASYSSAQNGWKVEPGTPSRHLFHCGVCDHEADASWKQDRHSGEWCWRVGSAFTSRCPRGGDCLRAIAASLDTTAPALKDDPLAHLDAWLTSPGRPCTTTPEELPTEDVLAWWQQRLAEREDLLTHLWRERGIGLKTAQHFEVGYASFHGRPPAFMQPVRDEEGKLVNLIESYWPNPRVLADGKPQKTRTLVGREAALYPVAMLDESEPRGVILTEGRWKVLGLIQAGLPAITSTNGTHWNDEWTPLLEGRSVAVLYDVDAEDKAQRRAEYLRAEGVDAWPVLLSSAGFSGTQGIDDAFGQGWSRVELRQLMKRSRLAHRRRTA